jgi:non-ribosomal peptide synthetase component F
LLDALQHGSVPLLSLLREIRAAYDPSRNPLFQMMISLQPPMSPIDAAWDLTQSAASSSSAKMDLYLNLETRPDGLRVSFVHNPDLLDPAGLQRMFADWRALLEGAAARPDCRIAELPMYVSSNHNRQASLPERIRRWFFR